MVEIARQQRITPDSFAVFDGMEEIKDRDGKSFFLIAKGASLADIRKATLMTYILNAGTDYGAAPGIKDYAETPYSAAEVQRIAARQADNLWSYGGAWAIESTGGSLVSTPNGMLMGLGGRIQDTLSCQGGTTYGDVFMVNVDHAAAPADQLRTIVHSGVAEGADNTGDPARNERLDLDRVLHHEERHSQQYARLGPVAMGIAYGEEALRTGLFGGDNWFEKDAGLRDGDTDDSSARHIGRVGRRAAGGVPEQSPVGPVVATGFRRPCGRWTVAGLDGVALRRYYPRRVLFHSQSGRVGSDVDGRRESRSSLARWALSAGPDGVAAVAAGFSMAQRKDVGPLHLRRCQPLGHEC